MALRLINDSLVSLLVGRLSIHFITPAVLAKSCNLI